MSKKSKKSELKPGDILVGTCNANKTIKDLFVVIEDTSDGEDWDENVPPQLFLVSLTKDIGWLEESSQTRRVNMFNRGLSAKELSDDTELGDDFLCYTFKRVRALSGDTLELLSRNRVSGEYTKEQEKRL